MGSYVNAKFRQNWVADYWVGNLHCKPISRAYAYDHFFYFGSSLLTVSQNRLQVGWKSDHVLEVDKWSEALSAFQKLSDQSITL